jgi:hypothetical protein
MKLRKDDKREIKRVGIIMSEIVLRSEAKNSPEPI